MDDVWLGRGATQSDVDACLKALSLQDKQRPPLLAVATGGPAPRLILASRALFALFGVATGEALSARLLGSNDPGARRLGVLCRGLALEGAPRLERLRFFMGPGTEIITFLCRRIPVDGAPLFIAAALGVRPGLIPAVSAPMPPPELDLPSVLPAPEPGREQQVQDSQNVQTIRDIQDIRIPPTPMTVQEIQTTLRTRWPASRTVRFLWQTDADMTCTQMTAPLADIVGQANADLVGRDLLGLAPHIDPSGRLAEALANKETWSGLNVEWPIADAPAGVSVGLGAIPAMDRDKVFGGYRGYGVIHLDRIVTRTPSSLAQRQPSPTSTTEKPSEVAALVSRSDPRPASDALEATQPQEAAPPPAANVLLFPGSKTLSPEDQKAFATLGAELREEAGLDESGLHPLEPAPVPVAVSPPAVRAPSTPVARREDDIARHGLVVLDRLGFGVLVSRDNVPIFANRHLLDSLGFENEDALHDAGGMRRLFGDQPANASGSEAVGMRRRDGRIVATNVRMQTIDWDGLPATLLTLHPPQAEPKPAPPLPVVEAALVPAPAEPSNVAVPHPETALAAEARELNAILETATDGVAIIDAEGNVTSLNRSGEALFGCDRGTVIGKPFLSLFAAPNQGLAADYLDGLRSNATKRLLNDGREFLVNAHRGGTIPVFMTLGRLGPSIEAASDEAPAGGRFCALFRDLTHWKKVERDLQAAKLETERVNTLKSEFLAQVNHEVRTPLNAIIGFAAAMMEERFGPVGNARYKDYLREIHTSGTHALSLVNNLLDLSTGESGKIDAAADAIDANKVIGECVAIMQPQASRARVIMRLSLAPALPHIRTDERALRQIVMNLLSNAVKFNEPGGQVIVATATPETGHVVIRIRDTGPGMSDAEIAAALAPSREPPASRATDGSASPGTGLPLTKALVEANQASFSIRSKVDQGTLVEVAFPPARVLAG